MNLNLYIPEATTHGAVRETLVWSETEEEAETQTASKGEAGLGREPGAAGLNTVIGPWATRTFMNICLALALPACVPENREILACYGIR